MISQEVKTRVTQILTNVQQRKLDAILEYTEKWDGIKLNKKSIRVKPKEIQQAYTLVSREQLNAIRMSIQKVTLFHKKQKQAIEDIALKSKEGTTQLRWIPLNRAGVYAPAGKAPLPSSVLMAVIPAQLAGIKQIILCSPPQRNGKIDPFILVTANECGITEIYKMGGAQAIAAMAYGCELFEPVNIIAGPGNVYTAYAKQYVASEGIVKIDTLAGPSEILILADETANAKVIASDMLTQAEHGSNSASVCITTSQKLAKEIEIELRKQLQTLPEQKTICESLNKYGAIVRVRTISKAIEFANTYASEHVEVFTRNATQVAQQVTNAGAVFIQTGEVFGDYGMSGSNHILPTGHTATFASGVSVYTFMKYQLVEQLTTQAQANLAKKTAMFARVEKLEAHARSAERREKNE